MTDPQSAHHYSEATGISLELPVSWHKLYEEAGLALYAGDSEGPRDPQILLRRLDTVDGAGGTSLAESLLPPGHGAVRRLSRQTQVIDGRPATVDVCRFFDEDTGEEASAYQVWMSAGEKTWAFTGVAGQQDWNGCVPVFEATAASIRLIPAPAAGPRPGSYFSPALGVSLVLPAGWEAHEMEEGQLLVSGPQSSGGYRPLLTYWRGPMEGDDPAWFDQLIAGSMAQQRETYPGYRMLEEGHFWLGEHAAYLRRVTWGQALEEPVEEYLQVFVVSGPRTCLIVKGTVLRARSQEDMAALEQIVQSTRLIDTGLSGKAGGR